MANKVKKSSNGFKFKYASLTDIANAGYEIPSLELEVINGVDYVCIKDDKGTHLLARVVEDNKATNSAMAYGSGLSYARRYGIKNWLGLVDCDDEEIENHSFEKETKATPKQIELITKNAKKVESLLKDLGIQKPSQLKDLSIENASKLCQVIKESK